MRIVSPENIEGLTNIICYQWRWLDSEGMESFKARLSLLGGSWDPKRFFSRRHLGGFRGYPPAVTAAAWLETAPSSLSVLQNPHLLCESNSLKHDWKPPWVILQSVPCHTRSLSKWRLDEEDVSLAMSFPNAKLDPSALWWVYPLAYPLAVATSLGGQEATRVRGDQPRFTCCLW